MPETIGLPEPEPTPTERLIALIAGRHIARTVALYLLMGLTTVIMLGFDGIIGIVAGGVNIVALLLLMASDTDLE